MASASYHCPTRRKMLPAWQWSDDRVANGAGVLGRLLQDVGDREHERIVVNAVALIWSRRLTEEEVDAAKIRGVCARDPAGTPWRVIWERGESFSPSTQPCEKGMIWTDPEFGILQVRECGECSSCRARAELWQRAG